jgi:hypothetical protein
MKRIHRNPSILLMIVFSLFWLASCSSDDPVELSDDPVNPVEAGNSDLEDELFNMINSGDIESPSDMDFRDAKTHFQNAVNSAPTNMHGHFGLSLTTLLALSSDPEINAAFDEWEAYLETHTPFESSGKALSPMGVPLTFASGNRGMELPLEILAQSLFVGMQPKMEVVEPRISRVQDIFRDRVIPALEESATHLDMVAQDPSYVFLVTPLMQGDAEEDTLELDLTEVLAARAGVLLLTSVCRLAVAYDLSFPSFDAAGIVGGLDYDNGNMLRLRSDGEMQMNKVEIDFLASVDAVDAGIVFLLGETDPQDNDIIKTGPDDFSRAELNDFRVNDLPDFRAVFDEEGMILTEDWDSDYMTPEVALEINAHNFFTNPISDWKRVLPPYQVSTREVDVSDNPIGLYYEGISVEFQTAGYAEGGCRIWVENALAVRDSTWGHSGISDQATWICNNAVENLYDWPERNGTVTVSASGDMYVGMNYLNFFVDYDLHSNEPGIVIPHLTWEANTFEEWKGGWGNHNFNGLIPEIQTNDELFTLFGISAAGWEKEFDIDWTDLD